MSVSNQAGPRPFEVFLGAAGVAFQRLRNFKECSGLSMKSESKSFRFSSVCNVPKSGAKSQTKEVLVSFHLLSDKTHLHKANVARKISQRYTCVLHGISFQSERNLILFI